MNDKPPPLIRRKEIPKYFNGQNLPDYQLAKWEENGVIHPFRSSPSERAWYYTAELQKILNPQTT